MTRRASGRRCYGQYLAGMCLAGLSVCAAGWLVVTALAFAGPVSGTPGGKWNDAAVTTIATGAGLALVAVITFACWATAWRRLLLADGVLAWEAGHRSRRAARRARLARARVARERAQRERAQRERAQRASPRQPAGSVTDSDSEPEPVRPANADRVLSELREQLGPLVTALDTEPPPAAPPPAQDPSAALSPAAPGTAAPEVTAPEATAAPGDTAPEDTAPGEPRAAQEAPRKDAATSLVAICADGVISYDQEEDW